MKPKSAIFLSASIPDRDYETWKPAVLATREAVLALVSVVVRERFLVFGGHPAISPLVEHAARTLESTGNVFIYQSAWFAEIIPAEARAFENFTFTPKGATRKASLKKMRKVMLDSKEFKAGVFIGGMEGVDDEYKMFRKRWPRASVFPIASTGGAARRLWERGAGPRDGEVRDLLENSKRYRALFRRFLMNL
ncbi:MAG TPA: hypothetical protein VN643_01930 [Pyrinomonadaceae bacterium]|nr:hypothetical protein [Pyrinomonadaceae bacterium]